MTTTLEPTAALDTPTRAAGRLWPQFLVAFLLGIVAILVVGVGAMYAYDQQYQGRVLPGVRVGHVALGGLTRDEAAAKLHEAFDGLATGTAVLVAGDASIPLPFSRARRGPDIDAMVERALSVGRAGNFVERAIADARTAIRGVQIDPLVRYDQESLTRWVNALAAAQHFAPSNARIARTKTGFEITPSVTGHRADPTTTLASLTKQIASLDAPAEIRVDLPLSEIEPSITTDEANAAVAIADRMATDISVVNDKDSWTIPAATVRSWISFQVGADGTIAPVLDESRLDRILGKLEETFNRAAKNAGLKRVGRHIVATGASHPGQRVDAAGMKAALLGEIRSRQAGLAASPVPAVVEAVQPKLSTAAAKEFAPKMKVISSFSVFYWVIVNNHWGGNIEAPATKIDGTVVPPGGVFDFWKVVGDLRKLPGTGPGNAIEGGKITVTGAFGGGICTTSTTLFNAAFRAGMVPLARKNHNEYITRYPAGLDATVWIVGRAKQTMSFKNDTKYPILIQRTITQDGNIRWLTFKIWSVPNGRTYKISNTVIQHGPKAIDTIERDPTKPVGYRYRNNAPADGAKVWVTVSIYDRGKLHWSKRYFSNYPAVNGVLVIGTKVAT